MTCETIEVLSEPSTVEIVFEGCVVEVVGEPEQVIEVVSAGPQGAAGLSQISADAGNRVDQRADGIFVSPVAEGSLVDMVLIFENALT